MNRQKKRRRRFRQRAMAFAVVIGMCLLLLIAGIYVWKKNVQKATADEVIIRNTEVAQKEYIAVIDAGHGGKDQGCAYGSLLEKDINLDIAKRLSGALEKAGVTVVMTRDEDVTVSLDERVRIAEEANATVYISIHTDSYEKDVSVRGMTVHYQKNANMGKKLANYVQEALQDADFAALRDVHESNWYVTRNTTMAAVLFESGYITNEQDLKHLTNKSYRQQIAECMAKAVVKYLNEIDA